MLLIQELRRHVLLVLKGVLALENTLKINLQVNFQGLALRQTFKINTQVNL